MNPLFLKIFLLFTFLCLQYAEGVPIGERHRVKRGIEEKLIDAAIDFVLSLILSISRIQENVARLPTGQKSAGFGQEEMVDGIIDLALNVVGQLSTIQETVASIPGLS